MRTKSTLTKTQHWCATRERWTRCDEQKERTYWWKKSCAKETGQLERRSVFGLVVQELRTTTLQRFPFLDSTSGHIMALPIAQLELLKFKANQIIDSIQALQRTIDVGGQNVMPAWPDILSKYNVILSQTHSFSQSLLSPQTQSQLVQAQ